jgi:WG containing repeat
VFPFSEGLAAVRIKGRYGFIDTSGTVVVEPRFDLVGDYDLGLAEVLVENKAGVIDRQGHFVVEPQFARAIPFTKDVLLVSDGPWPAYDPGMERLPNFAQELLFSAGGSFGLYSIRSGWLTKPIFHLHRFEKEGRGLVWASTQHRYDGPFGLLRADGTWQVEPQYSRVQELVDERAIVRIPDQTPGQGRPMQELAGAVDSDGKLVVPLRPWQLSYWRNGLGLVSEDGKAGLIDKAGNLVGGRLFDQVERAETGDVSRVLLDGTWVGLTREGHIVADPGQKPSTTTTGNEQPGPALPPITRASYLKCGPDGATFIASSNSGGPTLWGIADATGREIIRPIYRALHCFRNGVAWVPIDATRQWCPVGPEGVVRDHPRCVPVRYPHQMPPHVPERFSDDPYENSVLWSRAFLEFGAGSRMRPPHILGVVTGDGVGVVEAPPVFQ